MKQDLEVIWLFLLSLTLCSIGLLMVYETTSAEVIDYKSQLGLNHAFLKQLLYALFGVGFSLVVIKVGYERICYFAFPILGVLTFLLILVFVPGIGMKLNGARRWLKIGLLSFQPSEFVKIMLPIAYIRFLSLGYEMNFKRFILSLSVCLIPIILVLMEPDNGSVAILMATFVALFFLAKINWRYYVIPILVMGLFAGCFAFQLPYVRERISVYLNPESDLLGRGHQPHQAKIATGAGGLIGRGLGNSIQKMSYLPESRSDYIAAIYAEECGFIGIVVLELLYMGITLCGFLISLRAKDENGRLIAAALTFLLAIQAFINLGVVSGLLPSKGTNLPLFSHGGTSLVANFTIIALLIDINLKKRRYAT